MEKYFYQVLLIIVLFLVSLLGIIPKEEIPVCPFCQTIQPKTQEVKEYRNACEPD